MALSICIDVAKGVRPTKGVGPARGDYAQAGYGVGELRDQDAGAVLEGVGADEQLLGAVPGGGCA